jgi:two-component system chemotaxis response regulator CheB
MGSDGAKGMVNLHNQQAVTIAQDEASSVVYGMPHEAYRLGGVTKVCALGEIPRCIFRYISSESL